MRRIKLLYSPTGEYNKTEIYKMAASRFVEVSNKEISEIKINSVLKNTKGLCKNTKTIVRLRLSDYRGIFTSYKHTPILYSTNFWHSSKVQIENCNHGTVRGNKATALQLYSSTTLQPDSSTTLQLYNTTASGVTLYQGAPGSKFSKAPLVEVPKARVERRICTSFLGGPGHAQPENF